MNRAAGALHLHFDPAESAIASEVRRLEPEQVIRTALADYLRDGILVYSCRQGAPAGCVHGSLTHVSLGFEAAWVELIHRDVGR